MKTGEIYQLGNHKLLCGDCITDIERMMKGNKIRMILTDPPYGVAYVENKDWLGMRGVDGNHKKKIENDQLQTDEEYTEFTRKWLEAIKPFMADYNTAHIFNSDLMMCSLREGMKQAGWKYSQMVIWIKNSIVLGRKDYNPQHEVIAYGWTGRHKFERSKSKSVLFYPKPNSSKLHPTMKPLGLLRKMILNTTKIDETIYDPFGGSGSTLMACENTHRKCYMVEMDPEYCEIIIKRWEKTTNKKSKLL